MFFSKLPKNIQDAVHGLVTDEVFQNTFGHDSILDELDDEKNNLKQSFPEFLSTVNFKLRHNGKEYNNLTPMVWGFLWCIQSPLVRNMKKNATQADIDLFFYVLENGVDDCPLVDMAAKAINFCANHNISIDEASDVMHLLASRAFAPLKMFPAVATSETQSEPVFDSDWLTALVSKVHTVTGYTPDYIMNKLSMTACCYYYVQYARQQGVEHIEKRPPEEILKAQSERSCVLICDRLIELGVITEEQRAEVFKIMTTPPEK